MTTTLITGKGGTPHITSGDMGAMQAGIIGNGSYLLQGADGKFPAVTMQDANHALIPVLNLVVEGRYARVTEAETATIESGMSGRNRNDLVCLKYTRNGQNIETAAIAVLKGTPNTGTAADPTVPSGSIHSASGTAWIPIARIPISGITPGTPVMLIKQLPPMSKLWDSVTQTCQLRWQDTASFVPASYGASNTITVKDGLIFVDLSSFRSTVKVGDYSVWLFEEGVKPSRTVGLGCVANVAGIAYGKQARWNTNGSVTLIGGVGSADIVQCFSKIIPVPDGVEFV
ncbi:MULTISPECIES: hypothetical protein [Bifidobacterium]|jgi:hypothetical protein|nr:MULTISPECIES: hypothetical protein [Bifidobacterium]KXS25211.1 MAG: hypothetical protein AYW84_01235 [Bifidobacterium pseudocatenulatum]MCB4878260.1 hypothetical protein [Bifidobacterium pseudocatenulatum]MCB4905310.1 hypothetical protein [Bifidobacterium pseudocatenulatum]RGL19310.1 hypothetical protein DXC75_04470 [Bifidobacterium pseudocatenulatum]RGL54992.1 hypothetical protein DXC60_05455 [Bifidobacterium adolescentis]